MDYLKTACPFCQGHVEYPKKMGGHGITCPHCLVQFKLPPKDRSGASRALRSCVSILVGLLAIGGLISWLFYLVGQTAADPKSPADSPKYAVSVEGVKVEDGYIVGHVINQTSANLRRVTISYSLYDHDGAKVGNATDYLSELGPSGVWKFKAYVYERDARNFSIDWVTCSYGRIY